MALYAPPPPLREKAWADPIFGILGPPLHKQSGGAWSPFTIFLKNPKKIKGNLKII